MNWKCLFVHSWDGCKCKLCGKIRNVEHDWELVADKCEKRCTICGKSTEADSAHRWNGCKCLICGKKRDMAHDWNGCKCYRCGEIRHKWEKDDSTIEYLPLYRNDSMEAIIHTTYRCQYCGTKTEKSNIVQLH